MSLLSCINNYKEVVRIVSASIIVLQIARIAVISTETSKIVYYYPQTHTLVFCITSILLGFLSIGLEGLIFWALRERKIAKIQPWFLTTFVIFLIASLAFAVTTSLYIIRPWDHNIKVKTELKNNKTLEILELNHTTTTEESVEKKNNPITHSHNLNDSLEQLSWEIKKVLDTFVHHENENDDEKQNSNTTIVLFASLNNTEIFSKKIPLYFNQTKCSKKELKLRMVFYGVRPLLSLSFLLDVIRSFPQLFIVNRYVKSERLHHMHYHSHGSLATLYIKQ